MLGTRNAVQQRTPKADNSMWELCTLPKSKTPSPQLQRHWLTLLSQGRGGVGRRSDARKGWAMTCVNLSNHNLSTHWGSHKAKTNTKNSKVSRGEILLQLHGSSVELLVCLARLEVVRLDALVPEQELQGCEMKRPKESTTVNYLREAQEQVKRFLTLNPK